MSESPFAEDAGGRDYLRALIALVCVAAVVLGTAVLPVLAPAGTGSPLSSLVPLPRESPFAGGGGAGAGGGSGGLGALNPGQSTDVGGSLSADGNALRSQSSEVHFTVQSTEPAYWRTGAYGKYTGSGWEQAGGTPRSFDGSLDPRGMAGGEVSYAVTLAKTARALPTVWRPRRVSRSDALVTASRAVRAGRPVPAGTEYRGASVTPPRDPAVLRTAGRDYPDVIEARYAAPLPESDERLGPFTDNLTADADSPYETATTIERWLEANKEYSLNVSQPPEDGVASQFVFEMEAGYCEYFATAMAAMLRSQDVPARYVVGYSTGERTGDQTYTVRAMNAHAWVEVYFPDVGWVRFDPTPGRERLRQEAASLRNRTGEAYTAREQGSPNETFAVDENRTVAESTPTQPPEERSTDRDRTRQDGEYTVELNRSATPGAVVEVLVRRGGRPVEGATVRFNGDPVGRTDADGSVVARVPYERQLRVDVVPPDGGRGLIVPPGGSSTGDRLFAVAGPRQTNATYNLSTAASVSVTGQAVTGGVVTVIAAVDGVPVRDATVLLDGEGVARTDTAGRATVALPETPGNVTVAVRRGPVGGNATVSLPELTVSGRPTLPLALPGTGYRVNATMGGEPVPNATVAVGGERAGRTGVDGTATVGLPMTGQTTVTVGRHGQRATVAVDGLYPNLALAVAFALAVLGGAVVGARRRNVTPARVAWWLRRAGSLAVVGLVALGDAADGAVGRFRTRVRRTLAHLRGLLAGEVSLERLLAALRAWVATRRAATAKRAATLVGAPAGEDATAAGPSAARVTVREGWQRLLAHVSLREYWTHTPGEIAAHAVEVDDLPPDAVRTLRDAFRAVEYGERDADDRVPGVERAVDRIEAAAGEDE